MKTLKMKKTLLTAIALVFSMAIMTLPLTAQEDGKKTVRIKTTKIVNGEKIETDTTYEISDLKELEKLEDFHVIVDRDMISDLDIDLEEINGIKDMNVKVVMTSDSLDDLTERIVVMTKELEGMEGDLDELMKNMEVMVEMSDSLSGEKKVTIIMDGDDESVYMINGEDMGDLKWVEEGDGKVIIIKSNEDGSEDIEIEIDGEGDMVLYNVNCEGAGDGEKEIFVDIIETKDGDGTTIKSKIIICPPNEKDIDKLHNAGVAVDTKSKDVDRLELEDLSFYPNPTSGKFNLKFKTSENEKTSIKIFDVNGKEVYNETIKGKDGLYEKEIDISNEQKGTYFLKVSQGKKIATRKIILE
jgi:hypothetical protein